MKIVREGIIDPDWVRVEDGGCAMIAEMDEGDYADENGLFFRLHSWSEKGEHPEMQALVGKRVKVTLEVLDEKELEEGDKCPKCDGGTLRFIVDECSCHINPPCSACVKAGLTCDKCGYKTGDE